VHNDKVVKGKKAVMKTGVKGNLNKKKIKEPATKNI